MTLLPLMKERYSARSYSSKKIEKEVLNSILEAGQVAPTGANRQTHRILVVESKDGIEKAAKASRIYNPPMLLIVCSESDKSWVNPYDGKDLNDIDCSIVCTHMMLEAKAQGVDSLWLNWFDPEILNKEFNIPEGYEIINLLALGYSDKEPLSPNRHNDRRKPLIETVFFEKF